MDLATLSHELGLARRQIRDIASTTSNIDARMRQRASAAGPADTFVRALIVRLHQRWNRSTDAEAVAEQLYGRGHVLSRAFVEQPGTVFKSPSGPATTGTFGWAAAIVPVVNYPGPR